MKIPPPDPRVDSKENREHWLPRFEQAAKLPLRWLWSGQSLFKAASLLRPQIDAFFASVRMETNADTIHGGHDLPPVYMMLMAFALENLAKGILIAREPERVKEAMLKQWEGGGHDLNELAKAAKLNLTKDEKRLLLNLSVHAVWMGRYPCPKYHDQRLPRTTDGGGFAPLGGASNTDMTKAQDVYHRWEQILDAEIAAARSPKVVRPAN